VLHLLSDESNFAVEQVAKVTRKDTLSDLIPDLVSASYRFLNDGAENDKQGSRWDHPKLT
jgi:hypothetical protein